MNSDQLEDLAYLSGIKNGDERSFDSLFLKYHAGLLRFSKSLLGSDREEAEDIVQEVFLKIWQQRTSLNIHTSLAPFLFTSVKNRIYDQYRKNEVVRHDDIAAAGSYQTSSYLEPDQLLMFKQLYVDMDLMIGMLPERTQLVFRMNREDQLSYEDIAQLLNISLHSVKTHMYRAIKFLKNAFRQYNFLS